MFLSVHLLTGVFLLCNWHLYLLYRYLRWSDVTESMVTIRSPFCGYNSAYCMELKGEDLRSYSHKIESVYENFHAITTIRFLSIRLLRLLYDYYTIRLLSIRLLRLLLIRIKRIWATSLTVTNISESFTHKIAAKTSWHRYETKLRHCQPMYLYMCFLIHVCCVV